MSMTLIGVMGPGDGASAEATQAAFELGQLVAREGWVLLSGGREAGVMDAASRGAKAAGGLTIGILPDDTDEGMSAAIDIPILTGMGQARNQINVLSARLVIACGMGAGTASEVALALKAKKRVILLCASREAQDFFKSLGGDAVTVAANARAAIKTARLLIDKEG